MTVGHACVNCVVLTSTRIITTVCSFRTWKSTTTTSTTCLRSSSTTPLLDTSTCSCVSVSDFLVGAEIPNVFCAFLCHRHHKRGRQCGCLHELPPCTAVSNSLAASEQTNIHCRLEVWLTVYSHVIVDIPAGRFQSFGVPYMSECSARV